MNITLSTDLDRTLLPNGRQASNPQSISLLHSLAEQRHITLVYVSGRDKKLVLDAISEYDLPIPQFAITDVGTRLYRIDNIEWHEDSEWQRYLQKNWDVAKLELIKNQLKDYPQLQYQEAEKQSHFKLSYYLDSKHYESDITQHIETICQQTGLNCSIIKSYDETTNTGLLDLLPENASKYHALRFLMDKYTISEKEILFCGDSNNDMDVFISELPAVIVNNAQASVKQQAQQLADKHHHTAQLYIAKGNFYGLNGNYCSGILEGLAHYHPTLDSLICEMCSPSG